MRTLLLWAALVMVTNCGSIPDPDQTGRIVGIATDGGVTGCAAGQVGRTLTYYLSSLNGHLAYSDTTRTWCCPAGSTFAQCPGAALPAAECTGTWPGVTCPSVAPRQVGRTCSDTEPCPDGLACTEAAGRHFCSMSCEAYVLDADAGVDPCLSVGGVCLPAGRGGHWVCYPKCVLPHNGAGIERFANCSLGICAVMPEAAPTQRGVCYPTEP